MKKNKMFISLLIMILSIIILVVISVFSYSARSGSQELPAEIKSEKTIVSSLSEGILTNIFVKLYQPVDQDQLLMELENPQLTAKLENLFKEKNILENLINSETGGVLLTLRLNELDSKIKKKENELEKLNLEQIILLKDLEFYSEQSELSEKEYVIMQELSVNKQISDEEFNKASEQHYETRNKYDKLNNDFQLVFKEIETLKSEINNLRNEKGILTENISLTVSKNLIDLEKINSEISEMEIEIKNLKIFSSVSGIISDLEYNPGEMVKKGAAVIKVSTLENPVLVAYGNAFSMKNIKVGMKAKVISDKRKIYGKVISVSPIMKKIKSLTTSFETANTYAEILIEFDDPELALKYISIGQRLVVKIYF